MGKSSKARLLYLSLGDGHQVHVRLRKKPRVKLDLYLAFDDLLVKGRGARGNVLTKHSVLRVNPISERVYNDRTRASADEGGGDSEEQPESEPRAQAKLF